MKLNLMKSVFLSALSLTMLHMADEAVAGTTEKPPEPEKGRKIKMDDGRDLVFGEKQRLQKDYGILDANVFARIDFDNGKVVSVYLPGGSLTKAAAYDGDDEAKKTISALAKTSLQAMGHGLVQKLGDAAAGAESTDDALEAILEVAGRLSKGEWRKSGEGGGSAKGAGLLVTAMHEYLAETVNKDITKDQTRDMLAALSPAEKNGLMKLDAIKDKVEKLKAAAAPTKRDQDQKKQAGSVLDAIAAAAKSGGKLELPKKVEEAVSTETSA